MVLFLFIGAYSYLLGSIPFGYILVRIFYGEDIRQSGSGNIGATNVSRTSPWLGLATLILDAGKGAAAVVITRALFSGATVLLCVAAFGAIVGHIFPLWLKFRGGKGAATGLGSFVVVFPKTILLMIGVFVVILLALRYVSLASILSTGFFPLLLLWTAPPTTVTPPLLALVATSCLLIIGKHHENIGRLLNHTEPRFQWRRG